jgi:hypothetical protein
MFSSNFKLSYLLYSCAIELECSFHVIILTYELAYSLCVMILTCSYDMILAYELDYSFYARVLSYKTLCLNIHIICLLGFRAKYKWWFIMPSGAPKFFTCRSVGWRTTRDLGGHYIHRRGARVYRGGWLHFPFYDRGVDGRWWQPCSSLELPHVRLGCRSLNCHMRLLADQYSVASRPILMHSSNS